LDSFRTYQAAQEEEANDKRKEPWDEDDVLDHILNDMALEIFSNKHSYRHQVFMGDGTTVKAFEKKRVTWLNQCRKYFPMVQMRNGQFKQCKPLDEDELRDIYTLAIKPAWATKIMESNLEPNDLSLAELIDYLKKLEQVDKMKKSVDANKEEGKPYEGKKCKQSKEIHGGNAKKKKQRTDDKEDVAACDTCGKRHCGECWHKNKNNKQGNNKFHPGSAGKSSQKTYTMEEIKELTQFSYAMFGNLDASKKSSKKKHKSDNDERDGEINHMLAKMSMNHRNNNEDSTRSESESDAYAYAYPIRRYLPPPKKIKTPHSRYSEVVAMMKGSTEPALCVKKHVLDRKNLSKY
jgi:hypothetical protein